MMIEDMELVRAYARDRSEEAFAALVSRHVNMVHSVALRQVRDPDLAQEVTQTVFVILARKAASLNQKTIISGWLCQTARYASAKALTMRARRLKRENEAYMQSTLNEPDSAQAWRQIEPLLESAMAQLPAKDHDALTVRFFERRNFKEVSATLGTTEAGAKMRVNRALEKLRAFFAERGITLSTAIIASAVSSHSVQAAPVALAASATAAAFSGAGLISASTLSLVETTLQYMAYTKMKTVALIGAIALVIGGTTTLTINHSMTAAETAPKTPPGYATPEATLRSLILALQKSDKKMFVAACTPEEGERFLKRMESKTPEQYEKEASAITKAFAKFEITKKEVISNTETLLHVKALAADENTPAGDKNPIMRMKRIGTEWKYDGEHRAN